MKIFLLAIVVGVALAAPKWNNLESYTFEKFVADFGKDYSKEEYMQRKQIFEAKLKEIKSHNAKKLSWHMGVNHMSDWTHAEFMRLNGARPHMAHLANTKFQVPHVQKTVTFPDTIDYRNSVPAILTAVKDQGECGSCWAHGATEQMETYWAISTGQLNVLSQQQVTACTPNPNQCGGTGGCMGSIAELAYENVITRGGLTSEWIYPYTAWNGTTGTCETKKLMPAITLSGYTKVSPANDQNAVMQALASNGPLAVNVDASSWSNYAGGIFSGCNYASNISIDHVVQLVGFGKDTDLNADYWIIRNSWTPAWGENGFIRLLKQSTAQCGWDVDPQDGTGCKGGPPQLWVCGECGVLFDTSYPIAAKN